MLWCIATGTRGSLLHRQGAALRAGEEAVAAKSGTGESFPGGIASDQAVTRGPMNPSGDLIGGATIDSELQSMTGLR